MSGGIVSPDDTDDGGLNDVESSILDEVQDATGVSFDDDEEVNNTDDVTGEEDTQKPQKAEKPADKQASKQDARSGKVDSQYRGDNLSNTRRWIDGRRGVDYDYNKETGDVVDKEGNVIFAKDSPARDLFAALKNEQFERHKLLGQANGLFAEYNKQKEALAKYEEAFSAAKSSGLKLEDQALAMQHMAAYRSNPVQAIRKLLHDYQVDGGDLSDIFEDLPKIQGTAAEARLQALAERIEAPSRAQQQSAREQQELADRLNGEIQTFFGENPEAQNHVDTLAHIINTGAQRGQKISLGQAYTRLLRFCADKGLSIHAPLRDQLSDEPEQAPQQNRQQRSAPMPGRGRVNGVVPKQNSTPLHERRNRDLVREAMEESGISFSD